MLSMLTQAHLQKTMQTKIYQLGCLLPVWASTKLLEAERYQLLFQEIQQLSGLQAIHFEALYRPAIDQFAEFVQAIPDEPQGVLGGLLNLGLVRATLGLRQLAAEAGFKLDADPLVNYAIFTAGLFFDAAKAISQQKIVICDSAGLYLQEWYPYMGSMPGQKWSFYKMYPYNTTVYQALNRDASNLLARQMMPSDGFSWLSSDLDLFIDWLSALRGDQSGGSGRRITRTLSLIRQEDVIGLMKGLPMTEVNLILPKELQADDQFFIWLREGLANGSIAVNTADANVHILDNGTLYLNNEIFNRFQEANKFIGNVSQLAGEFNERFGLDAEAMRGKQEYATFLMQRSTNKTIQVRNGMFALGTLFFIDMNTIGVAISPLQKEIKSALQQSRELPGVKQTLSINRRPDPGLGFKMR